MIKNAQDEEEDEDEEDDDDEPEEKSLDIRKDDEDDWEPIASASLAAGATVAHEDTGAEDAWATGRGPSTQI